MSKVVLRYERHTFDPKPIQPEVFNPRLHWRTRDGLIYLISEMSTQHLRNTLRLLRAWARERAAFEALDAEDEELIAIYFASGEALQLEAERRGLALVPEEIALDDIVAILLRNEVSRFAYLDLEDIKARVEITRELAKKVEL